MSPGSALALIVTFVALVGLAYCGLEMLERYNAPPDEDDEW